MKKCESWCLLLGAYVLLRKLKPAILSYRLSLQRALCHWGPLCGSHPKSIFAEEARFELDWEGQLESDKPGVGRFVVGLGEGHLRREEQLRGKPSFICGLERTLRLRVVQTRLAWLRLADCGGTHERGLALIPQAREWLRVLDRGYRMTAQDMVFQED